MERKRASAIGITPFDHKRSSKPRIVHKNWVEICKPVNRNVGEPADQWKGRVESSFLGPIEHPLLGKLVREAHQILRFEIEPGVFAVLRHGPLADVESGLGSYIVDIDVSVERAVDFDPAVVLQLAQRLNRTAFSIFKLVLSKEELHQMKTVAFRATEMDQSK